MPNPEWGVKRTCPTTGQRFYDLGKDPIVSPYTGEVVELTTKAKTVDVAADLARAKAAEKAAADEDLVDDDDLPETDDDATDDDAIVDDGDEDDDDVGGPSLSDEDDDDEPVEFEDDVLLDDDEDDDDMGDLGDVATKGDDDT